MEYETGGYVNNFAWAAVVEAGGVTCAEFGAAAAPELPG